MNGRQLAEVAFRTWGAILLLGSAVAVPGVMVMGHAIAESENRDPLVLVSQASSVLNVGTGAALGLCLALWGGWLARRVVPEMPALEIGVDIAQLQTLGFALVGLGVLVDGLQNLAGITYLLANKPTWAEETKFSYIWDRQPETLVQTLVQLAAGASLLVGRARFARAWSALSGPRVADEDSSDESESPSQDGTAG